MSARQATPGFGRGLVAAAILSLCGSAVLAALTPFVGLSVALRAVIALLGLAYVLYTLASSRERVGRITTLAVWFAAAFGAWAIGLPLVGYVLAHAGLVWLVRSLYCYSGLLPALADLGVTGLGLAFAVWAARQSDSAALAFWCFFLVQAFHALIPAAVADRSTPPAADQDQAFHRAQRAAEAAVRRLSAAR